MTRVQEIEQLIETLNREEFSALVQYISEKESSLWDAQLDPDAAAGRLDFLRDEAQHAEYDRIVGRGRG